MKNKILFFLLCVTNSMIGNATNSNLTEGWNEFSKNNFSNVEEHFVKATQDPEAAPDAFLSLAIYRLTIHKNELAFQDFKKFLSISKDPEPALFAFEHTPLIQSLKTDQKIMFYEQVVAMPNVSETIKCMAYERLIPLYEDKGEFSKVAETGKKIGSIDEWQLLGTFENISGSGFSADHGAIENPGSSYNFRDKNGSVVNWFSLSPKHIRHDKWIDFTHFFYIDNAVCYAQTFVNVPADIECQLRLGTSGSYKVWINDRMIMSDPEERNNDLDTYNSTIKLYKGNNRIVIQVGANEISALNFLCRVTDSNGKRITDAKFSSTPSDYNKTYDYAGKMIPVSAEDYYQQKIKNEPGLLLNYLLLAKCWLRNDKAFEALHVLTDAEKFAPNCMYLLTLKAEQAYRAKNEPGQSLVIKKMKELIPDNYDVLQYYYFEMVNSENFDRAESILDSIRSKYGETEIEIDRQITIYAQTKNIDKMMRLIDEAYTRYPDYYPFVQYKFIAESQIRKDNSAGEKVMNKYINSHHSITAMEDLSNHYLKKNDASSSMSLLQQMVKQRPYAVNYLYTLSQLNYYTDNYKKAHEYVKSCLEIAPYIGTFYELKGDILVRENNNDKAKDAYASCIAYSPTNYDTRTKLRKLENKPDIFDSFTQFDFKQLYSSSPAVDAYPEDNSIILLDATQNVVYKGGASIKKNYLMVKVFNATGIDKWKQYNIGYYSGQRLVVDEAFVIKKNGDKVDADRDYNRLVFTNLEVNDAICISYKTENYYTGKLAQHTNDIHYFRYYMPSVTSSYELIIDTTVKINYSMVNSDLKPEMKNIDEYKKYTWLVRNKPAIVYETDMPELADVAPTLRISTFSSWNDVADWYSSIASSKSKATFEVKELVKQLFPGKLSEFTDLEKAKRIYNFIVKEIRYSSVDFRQSGLIPQSTSNTLNSKIGDCKDVSTLFVSMCREVGLNAYLVLVCTNENGNNHMFMPTIDFDHCIAAVKVNNQKYYVELTNDCMPFGKYNADLVNAQALEINEKEKTELFRLPNPAFNRSYVFRNTTMKVDGEKVTVAKSNLKTGVMAAGMRYSYRDLGKEQQEQRIRESISEEYPSITLEKVHFDENLNSMSDSVTYNFDYYTEEGISEVGGIRVLKLPLSDALHSSELLSIEKRNFPLSMSRDWYFTEWEETINLVLPTATSLLKVPEPKIYSSEFGEYSLTFTSAGNSFKISRKLTMKPVGLIDPEKYSAFKSFMQKVIKADGTQLALK